MKLVGANANFRSQSEFAAVIEAGARIDHHGCRVDRRREQGRRLQIVRDDRIRVVGAVFLNVAHGRFDEIGRAHV